MRQNKAGVVMCWFCSGGFFPHLRTPEKGPVNYPPLALFLFFSLFFFFFLTSCSYVQISLPASMPFFRLGSVHGVLMSWDDCVRAIPDELLLVHIPDSLPHYAQTVQSAHSDYIWSSLFAWYCCMKDYTLLETSNNIGDETDIGKGDKTKYGRSACRYPKAFSQW